MELLSGSSYIMFLRNSMLLQKNLSCCHNKLSMLYRTCYRYVVHCWYAYTLLLFGRLISVLTLMIYGYYSWTSHIYSSLKSTLNRWFFAVAYYILYKMSHAKLDVFPWLFSQLERYFLLSNYCLLRCICCRGVLVSQTCANSILLLDASWNGDAVLSSFSIWYNKQEGPATVFGESFKNHILINVAIFISEPVHNYHYHNGVYGKTLLLLGMCYLKQHAPYFQN